MAPEYVLHNPLVQSVEVSPLYTSKHKTVLPVVVNLRLYFCLGSYYITCLCSIVVHNYMCISVLRCNAAL